MILNYPYFLILFPICLLLIIIAIFRRVKFFVPKLSLKKKKKLKNYLTYAPELFFIFGVLFLIISIAEPIVLNYQKQVDIYGSSIMLVLDMSESMLAEDFKPENRFNVAVNTVSRFIDRREDDLLGVIIFGTNAYLLSPLTTNHKFLKNSLKKLKIGDIEGRTAIGDGILNALSHLEDANTKSKIIILLTDGENNAGETDPITAAHLASALNIKIYTIGMGKKGGAPMVYTHPIHGKQYARDQNGNIVMLKVDEEVLKQIANISNGKYFRASNEKILNLIYKEIDKLEKSKIEEKVITNKTYKHLIFLYIGVLFILIFIFLKILITRTDL